MARPPLPLGTWGTITTEKVGDDSYRALTRFCDNDETHVGLPQQVRASRLRSAPSGTFFLIAPRLQVSSLRLRHG